MQILALFLQSAGILGLALVTAPSLWSSPFSSHSQDSFFTLSGSGQFGLACLSLTLSLLLVSLTLLKSRRIFRAARQGLTPRFAGLVLADGLLGLVIFDLFVWLSPQLYYLYYLTLFENLPWQGVVASPPSLAQLFALLKIQPDASLAEISSGVLGRGLLLVTPLVAAQRLWSMRPSRR